MTTNIPLLSIFFLPVLMLVMRGGYVVGNLLLLGLSIAIIIRSRFRVSSFSRNKGSYIRFALAFWVFAILGIGLSLYHQSGLKVISNYIPFLLAPIAYVGVVHCRVPIWPVWFGAATAGFVAFGISIYQLHAQAIDRAHGFMTNPIFFGNSAIIASSVSLIGLIALAKANRQPLAIAYLGLGAIAGIGASFFSGSKGGWISLPILMIVVYHFAASIWSRKAARIGGSIAACLLVLTALSPNSPVLDRLHDLGSDISRWINNDSSVYGNTGTASSRLEMWKFALSVAGEHPVVGFGPQALKERKVAAVANGDSDPIVSQYAHVHNEILDVYLDHGLIGLFGFVFLFGCLFTIFYPLRLNEDVQVKAIALAGITFLLLFLEFGLTNPHLPFNAPRNIFCGWAVVLAGLLHNRLLATNEERGENTEFNSY